MTLRKIDPDTYEPLDYRVLVRDLPVEEKTKGGIVLPETTQEADGFAQQFGVVIRRGPWAFSVDCKDGEREWDAASPMPGDLVNYTKYAGGTFQADESGRKYRILRDEDILGVVQRGYE